LEEIDSAHLKAVSLAEECKANIESIRSEEDAKFKIISRFLTEILGWETHDIALESAHDTGFSDYLISHTGEGALLVEAKRVGEITIKTSETSKVRHLKIEGPALAKTMAGIDQAASYSMPNGLPVSVLTDGLSWVVFKTFVIGSNYKSKEAIVFPSLDAILNDFPKFFELLSKPGVGKKLYNRIFDQVHRPRAAIARRSTPAISDESIKISQKSELAFELDKIFATFFSRLTGDRDENMLIECFVESRESRFADYALEKMTASVLGNLSPTEKSVDAGLSEFIEQVADIDPGNDDSGESVFIVGPTGAGKSTFLDRFFKKTLSNSIRRRCIVSRVNTLDTSGRVDTLVSAITEMLITSLEKQIYPDGIPSFEELQGLYHSEYLRRAKGADAKLYKRNKEEFKEKFGEYLNKSVEQDREGYLKRLLDDIVHNRKLLPILVLDNTDEFSINFKTTIFQFSQSLRRHARHMILIFPVTDKSAWSFSRTDIFGIYRTRSFFLPTPPPREVFRKRVDFLKERLVRASEDADARSYFTSRGIKISIPDMEAFANVLESIFVDQEYNARLLGELTNYNIRRTLSLSRRVLTSPIINIERLVNSYITGTSAAPTFDHFMNALLKGDWEIYRRVDQNEIYPIFDVDSEVAQSPLLATRILSLLRSSYLTGRNLEERHLSARSLLDYFDALGCDETALDHCLLKLLESGLIEPYDASLRDLSPAQKLAISEKGAAHLRLALNSKVFFEQMALTTPMTDEESVQKIRSQYHSKGPVLDRLGAIRAEFANYLTTEDSRFISQVAEASQFDTQTELLEKLSAIASRSDIRAANDESPGQGTITLAEGALATIDWFDQEKGFGFADVEDIEGQVFIHAETLQKCGIDALSDGDEILCDVSSSAKGIHISHVHDVQTDPNQVEVLEGEVIRLFPDRGYGFVQLDGRSSHAFFHISAVPAGSRNDLEKGQRLRVTLGPDRTGKGPQVKKVVDLL